MIRLKGVSFRYENAGEGVYNLKDIDLNVEKGECVVLCGKSGCGKTTVTRLINGLIPHYYEGQLKGSVFVDKTEIADQPLAKISQHVGSVFQNPRSQFFNVDTTGEIAFGCENQGLARAEIAGRIEKAAELFSLRDLLGRSIFDLSGGEKQRIACASVYAVQPDIFVLDEPSSNLDQAAVIKLKEILVKLKDSGHTIVISEHRLYYLMDLADRFIYLEDGKVKTQYTRDSLMKLSPQAISSMGLRTLDLRQINDQSGGKKNDMVSGVFRIENLLCKMSGRTVLDIDSLCIPAGETVAVIGHNGAGKSTFGRCFCGIGKHRGKFYLEEQEIKAKRSLKKSYMVMQDVNHQLFTESVRDEVTLNVSDSGKGDLETVFEKMGIVSIADNHPLALSGGQKQRVAITSAVYAGKKFLIYDEPTSGLDYESMCRACTLINEAARNAELSLVITHDLEFIMKCCTAVLHIENGTVKAFFLLDDKGRERLKEEFLNIK